MTGSWVDILLEMDVHVGRIIDPMFNGNEMPKRVNSSRQVLYRLRYHERKVVGVSELVDADCREPWNLGD